MWTIGFDSFYVFYLALVMSIVRMNLMHQRLNALPGVFTPLFVCLVFDIDHTMDMKTTTFGSKRSTCHGPTCLRRRNQTKVASIGNT